MVKVCPGAGGRFSHHAGDEPRQLLAGGLKAEHDAEMNVIRDNQLKRREEIQIYIAGSPTHQRLYSAPKYSYRDTEGA